MRCHSLMTAATPLPLVAALIGGGATDLLAEPQVLIDDPVEPARNGGTWQNVAGKGWFSRDGEAVGGLEATAGRCYFLGVNFPENLILTNQFPAEDGGERFKWQAGTYVASFDIGSQNDMVFVTESGGKGVTGGLVAGDPTDWKNAVTAHTTEGVEVEAERPTPKDGWVTYTWTYQVSPDATIHGEPLIGQPLTFRLAVNNGGYRDESAGAGNAAFDRLKISYTPVDAAEPN